MPENKIFKFVFPDDYPQETKFKIVELVYMQSFLQMPTLDFENQFEFMFFPCESDIESFRMRFKIPQEVKVIDTTNEDHTGGKFFSQL